MLSTRLRYLHPLIIMGTALQVSVYSLLFRSPLGAPSSRCEEFHLLGGLGWERLRWDDDSTEGCEWSGLLPTPPCYEVLVGGFPQRVVFIKGWGRRSMRHSSSYPGTLRIFIFWMRVVIDTEFIEKLCHHFGLLPLHQIGVWLFLNIWILTKAIHCWLP